MGHIKISGFNCHVAKDPVLFAAPIDENAEDKGRSKNKCVVTVIANRGTSKTSGKEITTAIDLEFWGKYAEVASTQLCKGRCLEIINGDLTDYLHDTGVVGPDGQPIKYSRHSIRVNQFEFGGNTYKEQVATVNINLRRAVAEGLLAPDCTITAEYLLSNQREKSQTFSRDKIVNGKFGYAKVWDRATGAWAQSGENAQNQEDKVTALQAELAALKDQNNAPENGAPAQAAAAEAGVVNPAVPDDDIPF